MLFLSFGFRRRQFRGVFEQLVDQGSLVFDGSALLHYQHGHEAIRNQEQNNENWQPTVLLGSNWLNAQIGRFRRTNFNLQKAPRSSPSETLTRDQVHPAHQ